MSSDNSGRLIHQNWEGQKIIHLSNQHPIWNRFYTVSPLVVIGTKEGDNYDLAPKHMAGALGQENYFGFVCTPNHATYHNAKNTGEFTVSYPKPDQIVVASLAAAPRCAEEREGKKIVDILPTLRAPNVDALFLRNSYLYLECELFKIIDGFGQYSLISGIIKETYLDKNYLKISDYDDQLMLQKAPLLGFLPYSRFSVITNSLQFPMPKDFIHLDA